VRVVIADTSPINYLILIDAIEILPRLYGRVIVPLEVLAELTDPDAPAEVARWLHDGAEWLEVERAPQEEDDSLEELDAGERAAIILALHQPNVLLLMDDAPGRAAATARGIDTVGTLGVLRAAAMKELVNLPLALARLLTTNFRAPKSVVEALISEDAQRLL